MRVISSKIESTISSQRQRVLIVHFLN